MLLDPWGPHGSLMSRLPLLKSTNCSLLLSGEIAAATFNYEEYAECMGMVWKRVLKDKNEGKNWRRIYKALLLLAHLLRNGSDRVVESARDHVAELRSLERFEFIDAKGKDQGVNG